MVDLAAHASRKSIWRAALLDEWCSLIWEPNLTSPPLNSETRESIHTQLTGTLQKYSLPLRLTTYSQTYQYLFMTLLLFHFIYLYLFRQGQNAHFALTSVHGSLL